MTIQLVSYQYRKTEAKRQEYTAQIINASAADLILFPGHTLLYKKDIVELAKHLNNNKVCAVIETKEGGNHPYLLDGGKIKDLRTSQWFATSKQIARDKMLCEEFLDELDSKRILEVNGVRCLLLQCGENNILKNYQSDGNRAAFRFDNMPQLRERFEAILSSVQIILNPAHTPMGNQGKLAKRRQLLSADGRAYFFTCNASDKHGNILAKSMQYAVVDGIQQDSEAVLSDDGGYVCRTFQF